MAESSRPEGSIWAVVNSRCGTRYIGYLKPGGAEGLTAGVGAITAYTIHHALRVEAGMVMVQTQEGPRPTMRFEFVPIDKNFGAVTQRVFDPAGILDIEKDLEEADRTMYEEVWEDTLKQMVEARLKRLNIATGAPQGRSPIIRG